MTIEELKKLRQYDPVTYVPGTANGNASHEDCEQGVFIGMGADGLYARVLYCTGRTIQMTDPDSLVIG